VELYALPEATADACARVLIEYFLRYGLPRRVISDNGVQFVSSVMRQCMTVLGVKQNFVPLYHPEANPAERKNRDLKVQLAQLVQNEHSSWPTKLPLIRYAMNSAVCRSTGVTPAYLTFGREMRSPTETCHDLRAILDKENFVSQITPYLQQFISSLTGIRERVEAQQDKTKENTDLSRRPGHSYSVGDKVLLTSHVLSKGAKALTSKFVPKRDGPYVIIKKVSPTTYCIAHINQPSENLGKYHTRDLTPFIEENHDKTPPSPVIPKRRRGRPKHGTATEPVQERGRSPELEGEHIVNHRPPVRISRGQLPRRYVD
jgi:hypothetical protein